MMMKKNLLAYAALGLLLPVAGIGCGDDDEMPMMNDNGNQDTETITRVQLTFTPAAGGGTPVIAEFNDPDGPGGNAPTQFDPINLALDTTYTLTIVLEDTTDPDDIEDITAEIMEEDDEHQFFFLGSAVGAQVMVNITDTDAGNLPVGLTSEVQAVMTGNGIFNVILAHLPDGLKTATANENSGDQDINLEFQLTVQ